MNNHQGMEIKIKRIHPAENELLVIYCHELTENVKEIVAFVKSRQGNISAFQEDRQIEVSVMDIFYLEAVDNHTFIYCEKDTYESRQRLIELEEALARKSFVRVSKSCLVNLLKIRSIKPALNGRFQATLSNGEDIIISRKYIPELRSRLKGGREA